MSNPSLTETFVLAILMSASLAATWWPLRRILGNILRSRKDPGFRLSPLAPRIRELVLDVLLQGKVIRERPLPGLAHALVFWGFCAFALATASHVAAGFGLELLSSGSAFGRLYFWLVAVFALAVAAAITGLAARRFLARPKWLGEVSPESAENTGKLASKNGGVKAARLS